MSSTPASFDSSDRMPFELGELLDGRFELQEVLGFGGFGIVYKASQITTGQSVAVKVLRQDKVHLQSKIELDRFKREMQIIAGICHTNIVRLIDFGELPDGTLFMVIEYIKGQPLLDVLRSEGGLRPREAFHLMRQILDALNAVHQQGIVYRDLKPANIMITQTGASRNAVLLDFGVSGISANVESDMENLTTDGSVRGTPSYMAPEQLKQLPVTGQADIYAWGLVFLETLMGRKVVTRASAVEVMAAQISNEPVPIPEEIAESTCGSVIHRAIEKDLNQRWGSAEEILAIMEHCYIDPVFSLPWTGATGLRKIRATVDVSSAEYSRPTSSTTIQSLEISGEMLEPMDQKSRVIWPWVIGFFVLAGLVFGGLWALNRPPEVSEVAKVAEDAAEVVDEPKDVSPAATALGAIDAAPRPVQPPPLRTEPEQKVVTKSEAKDVERKVEAAPPKPTSPKPPLVQPEKPVEEPVVEAAAKVLVEPKKTPAITFEPVGGEKRDSFAPVGSRTDTPDPWAK